MQSYNAENAEYLAATAREGKFRERLTAFFIGLIALGLAPVVFLLDRRDAAACFRESISHYFYAPISGVFFVMALTFVGAFLFRYRGEQKLDNWVASLGAAAALGIAFFPTSDVGCYGGAAPIDVRPAIIVAAPEAPSESGEFIALEIVEPVTGAAGETRVTGFFSSADQARVHFISAGVLFAVLLYFSAYAFTRKNAPIDAEAGGFTRVKRLRNGFYWGATAVMMLGGALILGKQFDITFGVPRPVFWGELLFLAAFGLSWMIKGRFLLWSLDRTG